MPGRPRSEYTDGKRKYPQEKKYRWEKHYK
jgi:hypothetical protein